MHILDIFAARPTTFSFEFFPPKTVEGGQTLFETIRQLEAYRPDFVSVTYGAGGSTREVTHDLVVRLKKETTLDPVPHLTCVCHGEEDITAILERYAEEGVIMTGRGMRFVMRRNWWRTSGSSTSVGIIRTGGGLGSGWRDSLRGIR